MEMYVRNLDKDKINELLPFDNVLGKYREIIGNYEITIKCWNNKLDVHRICTQELGNVPGEVVKLICEIDRISTIVFKEEEE